jgi:hypothetical protein
MTAPTLEHAEYCKPRPGEDSPRVESYLIPRYSDDGKTQTGNTRCLRCIECGNASYDGVMRERH